MPAELWQVIPPADDKFLQAYALDICALRQATTPAGPSTPPAQNQPCTGSAHDLFAPPWHLWQLLAFIPHEANPFSPVDMEQIGPFQPPAAAVLLATVFEYGEATYGPQRLPLLLTNYGTLHTWDSLTETVYGINTADFEAGWQRYLAQRYQ